MEELDAGAREGQEHHTVHDPDSHLNSLWFLLCVCEREREMRKIETKFGFKIGTG